jgi:general secretion pathway protein F
MEFHVRAVNSRQQIDAFKLEAIDFEHAKNQLHSQGLNVVSIKPVSTWRNGKLSPQGKRKQFDLLLFSQELLALTGAGLSVVEALDALLERATQQATRSVLQRVRDALQQGHRLSAALSQQPSFFPPLFVGVVQAAEGTSDLPRALERYVAYQTRLQALRHKAVSAAIYPAILFGAGISVALFLLGYVVPRFSAVYQNSSRPLSWASQLLLSWGKFASTHSELLAIAVLAIVAILVLGARRLKQTGQWARVLGVFPSVRNRIEILVLTRLYLTLGMLLEGGIPIVRAMQLCEAVLPEGTLQKLQAARHDVGQGDSLSNALEQNGLSTSVSVRMLRVGEQTGQMGVMLGRTAAFYDTETTRWIEQFSKAFEPLLMAAIGIVIGFIVVLLYMPIFDLAGNI